MVTIMRGFLAGLSGLVVFFLVIIVVGVLGGGTYLIFDTLGAKTSSITGHNQVVRMNNSGENQVQANANFNALYGSIKTDHDNIQTDKTNLASATTSADRDWYQQQLTGDVGACDKAVNQYDGWLNDTTMKDYVPAADPSTPIDETKECE